MAAKGSVADIRKKFLSRFASDKSTTNSRVICRTTQDQRNRVTVRVSPSFNLNEPSKPSLSASIITTKSPSPARRVSNQSPTDRGHVTSRPSADWSSPSHVGPADIIGHGRTNCGQTSGNMGDDKTFSSTSALPWLLPREPPSVLLSKPRPPCVTGYDESSTVPAVVVSSVGGSGADRSLQSDRTSANAARKSPYINRGTGTGIVQLEVPHVNRSYWSHHKSTFDDADEERLSPVSRPRGLSFTVSPTREDSPYSNIRQSSLSEHPQTPSSPFPMSRRLTPRMTSLDREQTSAARRSTGDFSDTFSVCSSTSAVSTTTQDEQLAEIRRLRQDLYWAKQQVERLTSNLQTNATAVEVFDQTLSTMVNKLHRIDVDQGHSNADLNDLLTTVESLRKENLSCVGEISRSNSIPSDCRLQLSEPTTTTRSRGSLVSRHSSLRTPPPSRSSKIDTQRLLSGSAASLSSTSSNCRQPSSVLDNNRPPTRRHSFTDWLRTSLGKAFSRKKTSRHSLPANDPLLSGNGISRGTKKVTGGSCPILTVPTSQQDQPVSTYCATIGRTRRPSVGISCYSPPATPTMARVPLVDQIGGGATDGESPDIGQRALRLSTTSLYDNARSSQSFLDLLMKANGQRQLKEGKKFLIAVVVSCDVLQQNANRGPPASCCITIGAYRIQTNTDWNTLDSEVMRIFKTYLQRLEPSTSLELTAESIRCYRVGEIIRTIGSRKPELLPIGYLVGDVNNIFIHLKGDAELCLDQLSFETLISISTLDRYMTLLQQNRRLALCGPSGTGKSFLALKLAQSIMHRTNPQLASDSIAVFTSDGSSAHQQAMAALMNTRMTQPADDRLRQLPAVIILNDVTYSSLLANAMDVPFLLESIYVIATTNDVNVPGKQSGGSVMAGRYHVVHYNNHTEPVYGFLGRYLKRHLIAMEADSTAELTQIVDWVAKLWQKVNKFLDDLSPAAVDITIGPKLFLACPMDIHKSLVWFTDLWNYFIVSYLSEAVRQSFQTNNSKHRSQWQDLSAWISNSWPWPSIQPQAVNNQLTPLRLTASDVGFDDVVTRAAKSVGDIVASNDKDLLSQKHLCSSMAEMLVKLQETAETASDSDSNDCWQH